MTDEEIVQAVADSITEFAKQFPARACLDGSIGRGATPMDVAKKAVEVARPLIEAEHKAQHEADVKILVACSDILGEQVVDLEARLGVVMAERDRLAKENDNLRSTLYQLDTEAYPEWESLYTAEMQALVHQVDERDRLRAVLVDARTELAELARWRWGPGDPRYINPYRYVVYGEGQEQQVTDCLARIDEALGSEA